MAKWKGKSQQEAGIERRFSEAFYPGDWLSDDALQSTPLWVQGAWIKMLCSMWQNKVGHVEKARDAWCQWLPCTAHEFDALVMHVRNAHVGNVRFRKDKVRFICRRLDRRHKHRQHQALYMQGYRGKGSCKKGVRSKNTLSSVSSSSSSTEVQPKRAVLPSGSDGAVSGDRPPPEGVELPETSPEWLRERAKKAKEAKR